MSGLIHVGITGQSGFIGYHLFHSIGLYADRFQRVRFENNYFDDEKKLEGFVSSCDVIVHLAAVNRHQNEQYLYKTNILLVKSLIRACENSNSTPHVIFASSTKETMDSVYGQSKKDGRGLFEKWAQTTKASFTNLIIPNVFGPFGKPLYNSVVSTFCYQITHNQQPTVIQDSQVDLIYVGDLIKEVVEVFVKKPPGISTHRVKHSNTLRVSGLLKKLVAIDEKYKNKHILPDLKKQFHLNLFNTYVSFFNYSALFPKLYNCKADDRGLFVETVRAESGGQMSFSVTAPGVTRGNHFHTRKTERFSVIKGKARIELRRVGFQEKMIFDLHGDRPAFVDIPVWHTHNISNTGTEDLYTAFWTNEFFDPEDPDTYFEMV